MRRRPSSLIRTVILSLATLLALAVGGAGGAQAQSFDFSYVANGMTVTGIFNTTATTTSGLYTINGISGGTIGGLPITLLAPNSSLTGGRNDNILFYPSSRAMPGYLDDTGFSFTSGASNYNTFYDDVGEYVEDQYVTPRSVISYQGFAFNVTPVPTPAPIPGGGLLSFLALGLAGLVWRRKAIVSFGVAAVAKARAARSPRPA